MTKKLIIDKNKNLIITSNIKKGNVIMVQINFNVDFIDIIF